jgi:hypothetical protein
VQKKFNWVNKGAKIKKKMKTSPQISQISAD